MRRKLLQDEAGRRTFALVGDKGEELTAALLRVAEEENIRGGWIQAIGGFRQATLGYFERSMRDYKRIHVREQVELLSLAGNLSVVKDGGIKLHLHAVLGKSDGSTVGGHLIEGHVWPTVEAVLVAFPAALERTVDEETRLPLLDFPA